MNFNIKEQTWWRKLLFLPAVVLVIFVILTVGLLIYSLGYENANPVIVYFSYAFSAYTLTVVVIRIPTLACAVRRGLYANKYSNKYLSESDFRAKVSLYIGNSMNVLYTIMHLVTGVLYSSVWSCALSGYYLVLLVIRLGLARKEQSRFQIADAEERRVYELKGCCTCGKWLFLLNAAVSVLVIQMIWQNQYYDYPGIMVYAHAAYAFYSLTMAIISMLKHRKMEKPLFTAAKVVSMSCALMSILALQTALLMQFGNDQASFIQIMNSLTGFAVCFNIFAMAVWLIHKTRKELKNDNERLH